MTDLAGLLAPPDRARIEAMLAGYERESSTQIAVAIFPSLEDEDVADFTTRVFERWRLGQQGLNNGALLAVFVAERRFRVEVGYGLEGTLTDVTSNRIMQDELVPRFRAGDYAGGIEAACRAMIAVTRGEYRAPPRRRREGPPAGLVVLALLIGFIVFTSVLRNAAASTYGPRGRRRRSTMGPFWWGGSGGGLGGGGGFGGGGGGFGGFSGGGGMSGGGGASGSW